jgi:hypothetical protein
MEKQQAMVGKPRRSLEDRLYSFLSNHWCGNKVPPMDHRTMYRGERVVSFLNDGWDVYVGTRDEWIYGFRQDEFRAMSFWYLRHYVFTDWFGLRTKLWYWLLHRRVERTRRWTKV